MTQASSRHRFAPALAALAVLVALVCAPAPALADTGVAAENQLPGTSAWTLTNPATGREIEGYASATSVNRGGSIALKVSTAAPAFTLEVFRTGWYQGLGARRVAGPAIVTGQLQTTPAPNPTTGMVDANWATSYTLQTKDQGTGDPWPTGVYLARLTESSAGKQAYILFVVRDDAQRPDVLYQLPVTTYQAYNFWGGKSLYGWGSGFQLPWGSSAGTAATKVTFDRPYAGSTNPAAAYGLGAGEYLTNVQRVAQGYPISSSGWDYNMVRWLERHGYDVGYSTNIDTHESAARVANTGVWLSQGHDEYWTWQMRKNVEDARDAGTNLAFFSANTAYWQIRLEPSPSTGAQNRVIVEYRTAAADPYASDADASNDKYVTVRFREAPVNQPEGALKGSQYLVDPIDADISVSQTSHWAFAGTGLSNGQILRGLLGYEIDERTDTAPANTISLAATQISWWPEHHSDMTIYTAPSGARVFGTGTIQWSWGLDDYNAPALRSSRLSAEAATITANVLADGGALPAHTPLKLAASAPAQAAKVAASRPVFSWTATGDESASVDHYDLWVDGAESGTVSRAACTAGVCSVTPVWDLDDGAHTWLVRATDAQGGEWSTAARTVTVDTTPPSAFALTAPADGLATANARPAFSWGASADSGTGVDHYDLLLDGEVYAGGLAAGQATFTPPADLLDGAHRWTVRAVDGAGNTRSASARSLTVDTTPPATTVDAAPPAITVKATARLTFSASEGGATFACRVDGGSWDACVSPVDLSGLDEGDHQFEVRASDALGNTDPTPAQAQWTVDTTTPPTARLVATPNPAATGVPVELSAATSAAHGDGTIVSYAWDLDGDGSFETPPASAATVTHTFADAGTHRVRVRVTTGTGTSAEAGADVTVTAPPAAAPNPAPPVDAPPADAPPAENVAAPSAPRAGSGVVVYSARDAASGLWRLRVRRAGTAAADVPVPASPAPFDADVGTDGRGRPVLVYRRCSGTAARPTACSLRRYALSGRGGEHAIRSADAKGVDEGTPTISRGVLAWTREERRGGRRDPVVYVRRLSDPASRPSRRITAVPRRWCTTATRCRATTRRSITALELSGTRLAVVSAFGCAGCSQGGRRALRVHDLVRGAARRIAAVPWQHEELLGPSFVSGAVAWYRSCSGADASCAAQAGPWRYRFADRTYRRASAATAGVAGFADDGSRLYQVVCAPAGTGCRFEDDRAPAFVAATR